MATDRLVVNVFNVDAALNVARARGMFAAAGIDVELLVTPNSTDQMRGLSKGSWQIVSTAFDNVLGWSGREGAEIVAIAQVSQGITLPVYVRPEIKSWDDLRGKKLAVDAVDTAYALVLRRIILEHGLDFDRGDYELIPLGTTGARLESMTRGETFAGVLNPPWGKKAEAAGSHSASRIIARCCLTIPEESLPSAANGRRKITACWGSSCEFGMTRFVGVKTTRIGATRSKSSQRKKKWMKREPRGNWRSCRPAGN